MRWKETMAVIGALSITTTGCGEKTTTPFNDLPPTPIVSEGVKVENFYSWKSPGGTVFEFDATGFPGTFYTEAINQALAESCNKPIVVPNVKVLIGPVNGFNPVTRQPDPNGTSRSVSIMSVDKNTNKPARITIGIGGGYFEKLKGKKIAYTSPHIAGEIVPTDALSDLNASIAEEVGYHACTATSVEAFTHKEAQKESAKYHMNFLKSPYVIFRPKGW